MKHAISIHNISKNYGQIKALRNISLEIRDKEIFGLIGPDGAGKTSLFRILTTLLLPDQGDATVLGLDVIKEFRKIRKIILGKIRMQEDNLTHLALRNFNKTLFDPHPYGMNVIGIEETVRRLTKKDLKDFYHRFAVPQNMVMAVIGDVHKDRVVRPKPNHPCLKVD
jgi:ABC-type Na+ transport system ATPase subunit NatA